jgi:N-methylhydantoinase B
VSAAPLDPITLEIVHNALRSVTDEAFIALMKSAYSTNIKERHDHSTTLMDAKGRMVAQAEQSLPIHLASMRGLMQALLARYPISEIDDGDLFIGNDPYVSGGTHLPDVNMAAPVFADGRLLGFVCNIAHHADIGGMAPGSMAGGMTEIYQEGLRIPVIKLFRKGTLDRGLLDLLLLNARVPEERQGDYYAQIASAKLGVRRMKELVTTYGAPLLEAAFADIIARTERRMRDAFARIPDGVYEFEDVLDGDGLGTIDIRLKLRLEIAGDDLTLDFRGSDPQVRGNVNATLNATESGVYYALKALLDPDVPNNEGVIQSVHILSEPGSVLDCRAPAAVAARAHLCQRIVDVIIGALHEAVPDAAVGAANGANTTAVFAGTDPRNGRGYVYLETLGGGMGARATKDGKDGVQVHITNTSNLPVEAIEMEYPLFVDRYELVPDSGGAGRTRGGLGLRRVIRPIGHTTQFNGHGERFRHQPWGVFGGGPGAPGRFALLEADGSLTALSDKPLAVPIAPEQAVVIETPGAGGYGHPSERDPALLAADARSGKFGEVFLAAHYPHFSASRGNTR